MLCKDVCKKCWCIDSTGYRGWEISDEIAFSEGRGFCPKSIAGRSDRDVEVHMPPPSWCPRKLEHAIAAGMTK